MEQNAFFSAQEKVRLAQLYRELLKLSGNILYPDDCKKLKTYLLEAARRNLIQRNVFGMNPILNDMETALIVASEIGLTRGAILGIMVHTCVRCGYCTPEDVEREFGVDVAGIIKGLNRILELYEKNPSVESENFRSLLLSFAEDMRVVLIMIANRVNIMRKIKDTENEEARRKVSEEAAYLYAPLAHKLGLYRLKSELEDLSLKYLEHDAYYLIKEKLNATKKSRDEYIDQRKTEEGRSEIPHERAYQKHTLHLAEDEEAALRSGRHLRLVCHPHHSGFRPRKRKDGMLAGLFHHHRHVSAQPQTVEGLVVHPQKQRLRKLAYHGPRTGEQMGGSANPNRTNGRNSRTRIGCALEIQRY